MTDYSLIDQPPILNFIFYPRRDFTPCPDHAFDLSVPVEKNISVMCRFYAGHSTWPWILFFHGNGEVVSDYDEIAPIYHMRKLNLVVADYRGYGASDGISTMRDLVRDAHVIFTGVREELSRRGFRSDLWTLGRSLGSVSALELAYHHESILRGLIIDSGFCSVVRIIRHLGIPAHGVDLSAIDRGCVEMIEKISIPSLILHGQEDTLVPLVEAEDLYRHLGTQDKELVVIPSAGHNDIMAIGFEKYFGALQRFVEKTGLNANT